MVAHVHLHAALLRAQRDHRTHVFLRHIQIYRDDGLAYLVYLGRVGHFGWVIHHQLRAVAQLHFVDHRGRGGDQVHVELALQPFLHDLHMQQPEETATKTKTQCLRYFWLVLQGRVIQLQLLQRVAQCFILVRLHREQPGEHLRLHLLEARQGRSSGLVHQRDGVTDLGIFQLLDTRNDKTHLPRRQRFTRLRLGREYTDVFDEMLRTGRHEQYPVLGTQAAAEDAHQHHHTHVIIEPGIYDERLQWRAYVTFGRWHFDDECFQHVLHAFTSLGRAARGIVRINADDIFDLGDGVVGIGGGQIYLVQYGHHLHAQIERGVTVGHGLCFHPLRRIHHQQRAFAGRERTRYFIGEVHMSRGVYQVEIVDLAVARLVLQCSGLCLDGDAALTLQIHGVQHLRLHLAVGEASAELDDAVSQCGFTVVYVGDDGKIADMLHICAVKTHPARQGIAGDAP